MMKKFAVLFYTMLFLLLSCACGEKDEVSIEKIGERLSSEVIFEDVLTELSTEDSMALYGLDESSVADGIAYVSSGATAEEVSVWLAKDNESISVVKEKIMQRMAVQKDGYGDYKPEEVPKLEKYILAENGCCLVLCVTDDQDNANEILTSCGF